MLVYWIWMARGLRQTLANWRFTMVQSFTEQNFSWCHELVHGVAGKHGAPGCQSPLVRVHFTNGCFPDHPMQGFTLFQSAPTGNLGRHISGPFTFSDRWWTSPWPWTRHWLMAPTICKAHVFESGICPAKNVPIQKETEIPIDTNIHQPDLLNPTM